MCAICYEYCKKIGQLKTTKAKGHRVEIMNFNHKDHIEHKEGSVVKGPDSFVDKTVGWMAKKVSLENYSGRF